MSLHIPTKKALFKMVDNLTLRTKIQREVYHVFLEDKTNLVHVRIEDLPKGKYMVYEMKVEDVGRYKAMDGEWEFSNMDDWYSSHNK